MFTIPKTYAIEIAPYFKPAETFPTVSSLINTLVPNILVVAGVVLLITIIISGFQMMAAGQADPKALEKTRGTLTFAIVGFIIVVVAYWLVKIIGIVTGVEVLNPNL